MCVSAAFLGDIALDEEDLKSFKVDRIIDLAQRTVQIINHTDAGNISYRCSQFDETTPHQKAEVWIVALNQVETKPGLIIAPICF